jgi:hypothetical protein
MRNGNMRKKEIEGKKRKKQVQNLKASILPVEKDKGSVGKGRQKGAKEREK